MFRESHAFSSFAVSNLAAAREFYSEVLGLAVTEIPDPGLLQLEVTGGPPIVIYPKPDHVPATFTVLNFPVADVTDAVRLLTDRGVTFARYDAFEQDELGIARDEGGPPIAWFTDPAGNILSVLEE